MKKIVIIRIFLIILILLWMKIVFGFSNDTAEVSTSISMKITTFFTKKEEKIMVLEPIIRKIAHLSEYAARWIFILWFIINF